MPREMLVVASATALFGLVHSLLAGPWVRRLAVHLVGDRAAAGSYRATYMLAGGAMIVALVAVILRQPSCEIYHVRGWRAWLLRAGQLAALGYAVWAAAHVGFGLLVGLDHFNTWVRAGEVAPMPFGQGPAAEAGAMRATGPFGHTRQPLNWFFFPLFWLNPRLTTRLLAFNVVISVYIVAAALHAEWHMTLAYGEAFRDYQRAVPFLARP